MKKLISLALISAMLLTFTACDNKEKPSDNSQDGTPTGQQTENSEPVSIKVEPVPEDGWTMEELAKTICIDGKVISNPFKIESLGSDYSWLINDINLPRVVYNGKTIATISFVDESASEGELESVMSSNLLEDTDHLTINGIKLGSTREEAEAAFGKPIRELALSESTCWSYYKDAEKQSGRFLEVWIDHETDTVSLLIFHFV